MWKWFKRMVAACVPSSTAGKAAAVTAIFVFLIIFIVKIIWYGLDPAIDFWVAYKPWDFARDLAALIGFPTLIYFIVLLWDQVEVSPHPDIDEAWNAGIEAIRGVGMSLESAPLFLILGADSTELEDALTAALRDGGVRFKVDKVPGNAGIDPALRWYVSDNAIYLFASRVGTVGDLTRQWARVTGGNDAASSGGWQPAGESAGESLGFGVPPLPSQATHDTLTSVPRMSPRPAPAQQSPHPSYYGTLTSADVPSTPVTSVAVGAKPNMAGRPLPTFAENDAERDRLRYLALRLHRERKGHCGVNGVLTLLPFVCGQADSHALQCLIDCIRSDLVTLQKTLSLQFPVTSLVVGMEDAGGFTEFAESLGKRQVQRRLGAGFEARVRATKDRLTALSDGICDNFETFVYMLFSRQDALRRTSDNRKLYALLCRIREELKPKLFNILGSAFAVDLAGSSRADAEAYFCGCYLAATGEKPDERAFIYGLLNDKLLREQSRVQWMGRILRRDRILRVVFWTGWAVVAVLAVTSVLILVYGE